MKNVIIIVGMGLYIALAVWSAMPSGYEQNVGSTYAVTVPLENKFFGTINSIPPNGVGIWNVNGKEVNVTKYTTIREKQGKAKVGAYVKVEGNFNGPSLNAYAVDVRNGA